MSSRPNADESCGADHDQGEKLGVEEEHQDGRINEGDGHRDEDKHAATPKEPDAKRVAVRERREARDRRREYR